MALEDVACLCSKYRQEAEEFDKLDDVLVGNVLQHQVTLTTTTLYNGVDMKDRALNILSVNCGTRSLMRRFLAANVPWMRGIPARYICCITPKNVWKENLKKSRSISWNQSRHIENGLMIRRHGRHICISLKHWKY